ncbi:Hsp20 family protein [Clostridium sp.]|uniref:Hsp20 family protein n=1 Tax=Clostridium sp. TaxID=1506 RepID=UPI0026DB8C6A|nr:Hsp20 family protein [Clostridium sp.]MDO5038341.1 Hsp20 family protein [Clostridium sp.]
MNRRIGNRNIINNIGDFSNIFSQTFSKFFSSINIGSIEEFFNEGDFINVNMKEDESKYIIEGVFPGIDKKDIKVDYKDDYIYININRRQVFSNGYNMSMVVSEFGDGFSREFFVPDSDISSLKVSFKNYRLKLEIPKLNYRLPVDQSEIIDVVDYKEE